MKIQPVSGPGAIPQNGTPEHVRTAKAVAAFNKGASSYDKPIAHAQPPTQVVTNQNQIAVEELGAIKAKEDQEVTEIIDQNSTSVTEETLAEPSVPVPDIEASKTEETPVEDPMLSRQFAQLARQEKALRAKQQQQEQAIKAKEADIAAREAAIKAKEQEYSKGYIPRDLLKTNPLQALAEAEVSYDEITRQMLEVPAQTDPRILATISKLEAKIQSLEQAAEKTQETFKSSQQQAYESAIKQIKTNVDKMVNENPEFETIKATKSSQDVVDLIVKTYEQDGVLLTEEEAAMEVENYILEEALKLSRLSKVSKRLQPVAPPVVAKPTQTAAAQTPVQTQPQMKTLTNASASSRPLTAKERAILAFKGELK